MAKIRLKDTLLWNEVASKQRISFVKDLLAGSNKKIWWSGKCGHEWEATPAHRYHSNSGCPFCKGYSVLKGFNDLATTHPVIAAEWHPTKNINITPYEVSKGNHTKIWWKCFEGHEWEASSNIRTSRKSGCPKCSGLEAIIGVNDLATIKPELAAQWHPVKNGTLTPFMVKAGSNKKIWWLGKCGHEWNRNINAITLNGCPYCTGVIIKSGFNDFLTVTPEIAKYWHPLKNSFSPDKLSSGSEKKVWWLGECGHSFNRSVKTMVSLTSRCPYCFGSAVLSGFNDIFTTHPDLISKEWSYSLNILSPKAVSAGSNRKVWWVCDKGHEWKVGIAERTRKDFTSCPKCSKRVSKAEQEIANHIISLGFVVEQSVRSLIKSREIDIYVPEKQLAFEFNGLYWHSEVAGKNNVYHYSKWLECKNKGIRLIQIWEDDWCRNPEQVLKMIAMELEVFVQIEENPLGTKICSLNKTQAKVFLNENHVSGFIEASHYLSLKRLTKYEKIVSMIAFEITDNAEVKIIRYATSSNAPDDLSMLVSYLAKKYETKKIIAFSDNCSDSGSIYLKNNFVFSKNIAPDYMYVVNNKRSHQNKKEVSKIWDAGSIEWVKQT